MSAIVIDNGSHSVKAGLAGAKAPSVLVTPEPCQTVSANGATPNWDKMEGMWRKIFEEDLELIPAEHSILLTQPPLFPGPNKEKMVELMFEKFGARQLHLATQQVLALQASGRTMGLVVDCGHGASTIVPVYKGQGIDRAITRVDVGGESLTSYLSELLVAQDEKLGGLERHILFQLKEKLCYVAEDYEDDLKTNALSSALEMEYELPDGTCLTLGNERFRCPEGLFQPEHLGLNETPGLHEACADSISRCEAEIQGGLHENIVLCGGGARLPGVAARIRKEVAMFTSATVDVTCSEEPQNAAWVGGSIFASLAKYSPDAWMRKEDYEESGAAIVHWKCDCV